MSGFSVSGGAVHDLGSACRRSADGMDGLDVATPFTRAGDALPGSQTAVTTSGVAVKLAAAVRVLGERGRAMASNAEQTALSYDAAVSAVVRRFGAVGAAR